MTTKIRPDIRAITRVVPPSGNLVQGQSELSINPALARAASGVIAASRNHYGPAEGVGELIAPLNNAGNVFYVCAPTPLQRALAAVLMSEPQYYAELRERFSHKRRAAAEALERVGFRIYDSGSAFYVWARIPEGYGDAMRLNEMLMGRAGVAGVPGSAFADSDEFDNHMRFCIAREDEVLRGALGKLQDALAGAHRA